MTNVNLRTPEVEYLQGLLNERSETLSAFMNLTQTNPTELHSLRLEQKLIDCIAETLEEVTR